MDLMTTLDVDLVAVETADEVAVLLDLSAPALAAGAKSGGGRLLQRLLVAARGTIRAARCRDADVVPGRHVPRARRRAGWRLDPLPSRRPGRLGEGPGAERRPPQRQRGRPVAARRR